MFLLQKHKMALIGSQEVFKHVGWIFGNNVHKHHLADNLIEIKTMFCMYWKLRGKQWCNLLHSVPDRTQAITMYRQNLTGLFH